MSQALTFNEVQLVPVIHHNQPWIRSAELAQALGYSSEKSVSNLYARNADEFSSNMSVVINLMTGGMQAETRIFSLRGCHLLAMFARTPVAKAFRVWVLDVLETLNTAQTRPAPALSRLSTPADPERKELAAMVNTWVGCAPLHYAAAWSLVNAHFGVKKVDMLTVDQVKAAIRFVRGKIEEASQPVPALPAAPDPAREIRAKADEIRRLMWRAGRVYRDLWDVVERASDDINRQRGPLGEARRDMLPTLHKATSEAFISYERLAETIAYNVKAMRLLAG